MNSSASPGATAVAAPAAAAASGTDREVKLTSALVVGALLLGLVLQVWIPPGGLTLVAAAFLASMVVVGVGYLVPGRLRQTIASFRFIATLLFVLAVEAILGTLVLQLKPAQFYLARYGAVGQLIVALRFDDIFHGLPFALLMALFGASVIASATLRWPVRARNAGFFIAHVGLMTSLAGAGASATLGIRGRIDLHAGGETATHVVVRDRGGRPTGEVAALGFDLHLDRFELVNYEPEFRIGYYEQVPVADEQGFQRMQWKLKASFDPDLEKHRLPGGDSFQVSKMFPGPALSMEVRSEGIPKEAVLVAARPSPVFLSSTRALVFERREREVKAYISHVSAGQGGGRVERTVAVNEPVTLNGWTLYQVNYNPEDPTYSGIDAVYDPGVRWVFLGFALICVGVFYMFYVEPRLKGRAASAARA